MTRENLPCVSIEKGGGMVDTSDCIHGGVAHGAKDAIPLPLSGEGHWLEQRRHTAPIPHQVTRGKGTKTASFSKSSAGERVSPVVPFHQGVVKVYTSLPRWYPLQNAQAPPHLRAIERNQALQPVPPMGGDLGAGVQRKPVDPGIAGARQRGHRRVRRTTHTVATPPSFFHQATRQGCSWGWTSAVGSLINGYWAHRRNGTCGAWLRSKACWDIMSLRWQRTGTENLHAPG